MNLFDEKEIGKNVYKNKQQVTFFCCSAFQKAYNNVEAQCYFILFDKQAET